MPDPDPDLRGPRVVLRRLYGLGRQAASGILTLTVAGARPDVFVLRRGGCVCAEGEPARRALVARLVRAASGCVALQFDGGVTAYPPGALHQVSLAGWVRAHLEAELDSALAEALARELSSARLAVRPQLVPDALDEADRRMLAALARPSRLDQLWPAARAPRFRLLAFLHFLRVVGALTVEGAGERSAPVRAPDTHRRAAMRLLGVDDAADTGAVKRAYRRLARALHPDLQPGVDDHRRRLLERKFAELTAAYEALV